MTVRVKCPMPGCGYKRTVGIPHQDARKCLKCFAEFRDPRVHTVDDGRGGRLVFLDGKQMQHVIYAREGAHGMVKVMAMPPPGSFPPNVPIEVTLRGAVKVVDQGPNKIVPLPEKENGGR